ncbi:MAG: response regulator transcription factor [Cytophagales bacterium]
MKILVVEDEAELRRSVVSFLSGEGYLVESSANFKEAEEKITTYDYDCVLLDINLPDGIGLDLLSWLRKNKKDCGVLVLSARDSLNDKVIGLDLGADDYLPKPFHLQELNARLRSVLRRRVFKGSHVLEYAGISMDMDSRSVTVNGKDLGISGKEYDILLFLLTNKNRVLSKESIAENVWGDYVDQMDTFDYLYTHIKNLRKKLSAHEVDFIKSVYGIGYKFEA